MAFAENKLTGVVIHDSVTVIGNRAFDSNQLASVTIGNSVTTIETGAFHLNKLTSVVIPPSVTKIEGLAFYGNQLTSITIGENVELGSGVFGGYEVVYQDAFENGFDEFYNAGGKQAGTYTLNDGVWVKQ